MDDLLSEYLEAILAESIYTKRIGRRLLVLVGALCEESMPEEVLRQTQALSRLIILQDLLDALMEPINLIARGHQNAAQDRPGVTLDLSAAFGQVEETRRQIAECDPVNYAQILAWVMARARERKLLRKGRASR